MSKASATFLSTQPVFKGNTLMHNLTHTVDIVRCMPLSVLQPVFFLSVTLTKAVALFLLGEYWCT